MVKSVIEKNLIKENIKKFSQGDFYDNSLHLFVETLGYPKSSGRKIAFDEEITGIVEIKNLFQITNDAINDIEEEFDNTANSGTIFKSYLFFAAQLENRHYSKTELSNLTREINKVYKVPMMVLFKYNSCLTIAIADRRKNKKDSDKHVLEKVTLIKDIDINNPHRGHIEILSDLSFASLFDKYKFKTFEELHQAWQKTLDTSELNKKFYKELSNWYFWAVKQVTFPNEPTPEEAFEKKLKIEDMIQEHKAKNVIRMLTRLLFVWFIKEKNLVPEKLFDLNELQKEILNDISPYYEKGLFQEANKDSIYYKAILQNLFFATLNCPIKPIDKNDTRVRDFRKNDYYGQERDANFLMRYEKHFKNPQKFLEMVNEVVPFLNGGLFECLDDKKNKKYIDGFSDNLIKGEQLIFPDYLFFGIEEKVDLSTEYGIKNKGTQEASVKGLINILKSYKFTVDENTPLEEEIALDPELLGKVFENLLASYNPETKTTARKQTGSFYTPREIVNYMVDESLIAYLKESILQTDKVYLELGKNQTQLLNITEEKNRQLIFTEDLHKSRWIGKEEELENNLRKVFTYSEEQPFDDKEEIEKLVRALDSCKILDPACGSGAFPMGVLQKMVHVLKKLDPQNELWKKIQKEKVTTETKEAFEIENNAERNDSLLEISNAFDERINAPDYARKLYLIENCIYGVDIQPIATQISKLRCFISLIVDQKIDKSKDNFGIRPLPNLEAKFVAANTLIGIDKPESQMNLFEKEINKIESKLKNNRHKLFSSKNPNKKKKLIEDSKKLREDMAEVLINSGWNSQTAKNLAGWDPYNQNVSSEFFDMEWMFGIKDGFDVVIGNPPYVFTRDVEFSDSFKKHVEKNYFNDIVSQGKKSKSNQSGKINLFALFIIKAIKLLKKERISSYIIPNNILRTTTFDIVRKFILENTHIINIVDLGSGIFSGVTASTIVITLMKGKSIKKTNVITNIISLENNFQLSPIDQNQFLKNVSYTFNIYLNKSQIILSQKISKDKKLLGEYCIDIIEGIVAHKHLIQDTPADGYFPLIEGKDIKRYSIREAKNYLKWDISQIHRTRPNYLWQEEKKIISQRISGGKRPLVASIDTSKLKTFASVNNIILKSDFKNYYEFILCILNSRTINWFYANNFSNNSDLTVNISKTFLEKLPIAQVSLEKQNIFISLVDQIMEKKKLGENTQNLEDQIDQMVYQLYELTDEEIAIVEGKETHPPTPSLLEREGEQEI